MLALSPTWVVRTDIPTNQRLQYMEEKLVSYEGFPSEKNARKYLATTRSASSSAGSAVSASILTDVDSSSISAFLHGSIGVTSEAPGDFRFPAYDSPLLLTV